MSVISFHDLPSLFGFKSFFGFSFRNTICASWGTLSSKGSNSRNTVIAIISDEMFLFHVKFPKLTFFFNNSGTRASE